jgi:hypothetical protein
LFKSVDAGSSRHGRPSRYAPNNSRFFRGQLLLAIFLCQLNRFFRSFNRIRKPPRLGIGRRERALQERVLPAAEFHGAFSQPNCLLPIAYPCIRMGGEQPCQIIRQFKPPWTQLHRLAISRDRLLRLPALCQ